MKLIVGLGNYGKEYVDTRHNIGFTIITNYLHKEKFGKSKYSLLLKKIIKDEQVFFVLPTTYMNDSGKAVKYYIDYYKIPLSSILIIQDDLDIAIGNYKLKINSSSGGHKGIQSIISVINSDQFLRLKVGISKPAIENVANYVLSKFDKDEQGLMHSKQIIFNNIIDDFIHNIPMNELMNKYN